MKELYPWLYIIGLYSIDKFTSHQRSESRRPINCFNFNIIYVRCAQQLCLSAYTFEETGQCLFFAVLKVL